MKLLVDGAFYEMAQTGIARFWSTIIPHLARQVGLDVVLLDRGDCPPFPGVERIAFPAYTNSNTAADSLLIDQFCKELGVDVFTSTYYTTPVTVPMVLVVYDMIPELLGFDLSARAWQEKQIAISFASYYACISENTRSDLMRFYPNIGKDQAVVTYCGVDDKVFRPRERNDVVSFKGKLGLSRPYYILVGSRQQHLGYKNATLLFDAVRKSETADFDILCAGGEPEIERNFLEGLPSPVAVRRLDLNDEQLSLAYAGAQALVFPSLYEGFGMPVVEAMACGCPVVTTRMGSLAEVAGEAAYFITGRDSDEMLNAMAKIREPAYRSMLVERGLQRATKFRWGETVRGFYGLLIKAYRDRNIAETACFFAEWQRLRSLQAEVDLGLPG
jgi:glycosyltransferase involved in cell wall biosynthesis